MKLLLADDDELITMALTTILTADKDIDICGCAAFGEETVALYEKHAPDVVLTDIRMPYRGKTPHPSASQTPSPQGEGTFEQPDTPGGLMAAEHILKAHPDACILLLTTFLDDEYIIRALRMGVSGYLLKQDYPSLLPAIRAAHEGQNVFGAEIVAKMPALLAKDVREPAERAGAKDVPGTSERAGAKDVTEIAGSADAACGRKVLEKAGLTEREIELSALIAEGCSNKEIAEKMFLSEGTVRNYLSTVLEKLALRDRTQLAICYLTGRR